LQYLYRKSSIVPEFLKGTDSQLYTVLADRFDVTLCPVVLLAYTNSSEEEGTSCKFTAYRYDFPSTNEPKPSTDDVDDDDGDDDEDSDVEDDDVPKKKKRIVFHVPQSSAIQRISEAMFERYGNEMLEGEQKYYGSGMFVRQRKSV
jgi:hypothetical protein